MNVSRYAFQNFHGYRHKAREQVLELEVADPQPSPPRRQNDSLARPHAIGLAGSIGGGHVAADTLPRAVAIGEELTISGDSFRYRQLSIVVELLPVMGAGHASGEFSAGTAMVPSGGQEHLAARVYRAAGNGWAATAGDRRGSYLNSKV